MKRWYDVLLDEKIITCLLIIFCALCIFVLVHMQADEKYIVVFGAAITTLVGSLVRGTTHSIQPTDSSQSVSQTTTITPKE
jgi:hypothetical protein